MSSCYITLAGSEWPLSLVFMLTLAGYWSRTGDIPLGLIIWSIGDEQRLYSCHSNSAELITHGSYLHLLYPYVLWP